MLTQLKKIPAPGTFTKSVSLALVVHGALLLLIIGFTIERVARPSRLTDASESLNSVLLQESKLDTPIDNPKPESKKAEEGARVAVEIPRAQIAPTPKPSEFHAKVAEEIPTTPPPPAQIGNPAPPKLTSAPAPSAAATASATAASAAGDGAKSGVVAFTNVKGDSARKIVYVIDGSGSMALCLPFIRAELLRSVARLDPSQSFQIVVFRDPPAGSKAAGTFVLNPRKAASSALLAADDLNKSVLRDWLETVEPIGRSTPLAGIEAALSMQPDLIFLLSRTIKRSANNDSAESNRALLSRLNSLNPVNPVTRKRATVIKALQFIDDDPTGLMQAIGKAHGDAGESYKVIPVPQQFRSASGASLDKN